MTTRRRLLFLSPIIPAQRGNGLAMRTGFFLDAYARRFEVDLAVFPILEAPEEVSSFVRTRVARMQVFPRPAVDTHFSLVAATIDPAARLSAFLRYGAPSLASHTGALARRALEQWTAPDRYDVVHVERLYLAPLVERWLPLASNARPRLVIDCDDDDALSYRRLAAIERRHHRPLAAAWAQAEADAFASMAQRVLRYFDLAFAASHFDTSTLSVHGTRVAVAPNVAPTASPRGRYRRRRGCKIIVFVASMGYAPNDDAARWLLTRIWPHLCRAVRTPVRLVLVGSNPSPSLVRLGRRRNVSVTGTVADTSPYYRDADLAVIPIRSGGGTRIKLLEAAAHQVPVVSTPLGAEGTTFRHGHDLLLADTEAKFVRACTDLLRHPERASRLALRARATIARDYSAERWARHIGDLVTRSVANGKDENRCQIC
jgi:glycosyltransferase involved in cell wall biosynthesis